MRFKVSMKITAKEFFDVFTDSLIQDCLALTGKVLHDKDIVDGLTYEKKVMKVNGKVRGMAKVTVVKATRYSYIAVNYKADEVDRDVIMDIAETGAASIEVTCTETYCRTVKSIAWGGDARQLEDLNTELVKTPNSKHRHFKMIEREALKKRKKATA